MDDRVDWILKVKPHLSRKQVKNAVVEANKKRKKKEEDYSKVEKRIRIK